MRHPSLSFTTRHSSDLNAVFGPTYQGEGPHTGTRCHFIRLGRCQLSCAWCDTPDTWDHTRYDVAAENPWTPVEDILTRSEEHTSELQSRGHLVCRLLLE